MNSGEEQMLKTLGQGQKIIVLQLKILILFAMTTGGDDPTWLETSQVSSDMTPAEVDFVALQ